MDSGGTAKFISAVADDLQKHKGASVIIAGDHQPPAVHALAHAMNAALGNVGRTVVYTDPVDANPVNQTESLRDLVSDMRAGKVDLLVILGGNPVYDAPADLGFADCAEEFQMSRCAFTSVSTRTRRRTSATGTSTRRTISKPGAMAAPTTARSASFSR